MEDTTRPSERFQQWLDSEKINNGLVDCKLLAAANHDASIEDCSTEAYALCRDDDGIEAKDYTEALSPEYH